MQASLARHKVMMDAELADSNEISGGAVVLKEVLRRRGRGNYDKKSLIVGDDQGLRREVTALRRARSGRLAPEPGIG